MLTENEKSKISKPTDGKPADGKSVPVRVPKIGSVVHYWLHGSEPLSTAEKPCAAIVTDVKLDGSVNLVFFTNSGLSAERAAVAHSSTPKHRHWTWTE